jgi:putative Ca2+/H+ antiporter (TMEM165/GDT1 family)
MEALLASFVLVAASEMGDKTQLLAFSLAARYRRPWPILAGILVATLANHALASSVGVLVAEHVPARPMAAVLGVTFIAFGLWTLRPDDLDEARGPERAGPFLTTLVLFFLAEMGDKTQLATVALAARFDAIVRVTAGTTLGMMVSDGLAVFLGDRLSHRISSAWVRRGAASLFFLFGLLSIYAAVRGG